jgi:DEAD/DEAH box helicase domain-containing protein
LSVSYPLDQNHGGIAFRSPRFARNYFTTGTVLVHPEIDRDPRATDSFATFLYEALLMAAPYERQDVGVGVDKVRVEDGPLPFGRRFVAIYDQTYGSLRLSGRLMESDVFASVVRLAAELAENDESGNVYEGTALLARAVCTAAECPATNFTQYDRGPNAPGDEDRLRVIMPGSYGVDGANGNAEFYVEGVAFVPKLGCVSYRGRYGTGRVVAGQVTMIRHETLLEIPGESQMGWYRMDTGETTAIGGDDKSSFDAL